MINLVFNARILEHNLLKTKFNFQIFFFKIKGISYLVNLKEVFETINLSEANLKREEIKTITKEENDRFEKELNESIIKNIDIVQRNHISEEVDNNQDYIKAENNKQCEEHKSSREMRILQLMKENYIRKNKDLVISSVYSESKSEDYDDLENSIYTDKLFEN